MIINKKNYHENWILILNLITIFNLYYYRNIEIIVDAFTGRIQLNVSIQHLLCIISILIISWLLFKTIIFKYVS